MVDAQYNPDDPLFLVSRSLDERLTPDEQRRLDQALAESPALRTEAEGLQGVHRLIALWSAVPAEIDWNSHAALIGRCAQGPGPAETADGIDRLLSAWAATGPRIDGDQFLQSVMRRVHTAEAARARARRYARVFSFAAPLAAAAAIALAVMLSPWRAPRSVVVSFANLAPAGAASEANGGPARHLAVVTFHRGDTAAPVRTTGGVGITIGAVGWDDVSDDDQPL